MILSTMDGPPLDIADPAVEQGSKLGRWTNCREMD